MLEEFLKLREKYPFCSKVICSDDMDGCQLQLQGVAEVLSFPLKILRE